MARVANYLLDNEKELKINPLLFAPLAKGGGEALQKLPHRVLQVSE